MHSHFPWPETYRGTDWRDDVAGYVQGFMSENLIVVAIEAVGRVKNVSTVHPLVVRRYPRDQRGDHTLHVRSWLGTYNETFRCNWRIYLEASSP